MTRNITVTEEQFIDLQTLYSRLLEGVFYQDHDEDSRLMGVLRQALADTVLPGMFREEPGGSERR
jgi:hypothetical protein